MPETGPDATAMLMPGHHRLQAQFNDAVQAYNVCTGSVDCCFPDTVAVFFKAARAYKLIAA